MLFTSGQLKDGSVVMNRIVTMINIHGETIRSIKALDDGTWWIWRDEYHDIPWTREKFGL